MEGRFGRNGANLDVMTPREFLEQIVQPNVAEFHGDYANVRRAFNAVVAVDALAAHIYVWSTANAGAEVDGIPNDTHYREKLANTHEDFRLLRDIAKAQKHIKLTQGTPKITEAKQISARAVGWGEGSYGHGRWGGPPQVVIDTERGTMRYVEQIVDSALQFHEGKMVRLNI
jgi:hypothetical protein